MKTLIKNGTVLFTEPEMQAQKADILIEDGVITKLDAGQEGADRVIDAAGKLVAPGLVNCHTHMYMSIFRDYADDLPFDEWLFKKIMPVEDVMTPEQAYWCNLLSCIEMIKSGTTTFLDMHMFKHQISRAAVEAGMRAVVSRGLASESREDPGGKRRLDEALEEMEAPGHPLLGYMLAPHAIYTCHIDYIKDLAALAKDKGYRFHIHLSETAYEVQSCLEKHGCTPVELLEGAGLFEVPTVAAHCVHLTDGDIEILRRSNVNVASCPISNMKLGNGFAPAGRLAAAGVNLCIGTDGASSNNNLNMFKEMSVFSYIHKGVGQDVLAAPAKDVLRYGTIQGAKALGLDHITGSIQVGKQADLMIIDLDRPQLKPGNNPVSALVYSANGSEVETVLVGGEIVMEKGELKTIDQERVYFEMKRIKDELLN